MRRTFVPMPDPGGGATWLRMPLRPVALLACIACLAAAEPPPSDSDGALGVATGMGEDALSILTAPARWDAADWGRCGLIVGGIAATALLDKPVQRFAQEHADGGAKTLATWANPLGTYGSFVILGGFGAVGLISGDQRSTMVLRDGVIATVVASGVITPVLKTAVGRSRPNAGQGPWDFNPFSGGASFPSGHTTQAFAVGSVIATTYDDTPWVPPVAYGLASLVGAARIIDNKHWFSDVVAGAAIGTVVGRYAVQLDRQRRITPVAAVGRDGWSAGMLMQF